MPIFSTTVETSVVGAAAVSISTANSYNVFTQTATILHNDGSLSSNDAVRVTNSATIVNRGTIASANTGVHFTATSTLTLYNMEEGVIGGGAYGIITDNGSLLCDNLGTIVGNVQVSLQLYLNNYGLITSYVSGAGGLSLFNAGPSILRSSDPASAIAS